MGCLIVSFLTEVIELSPCNGLKVDSYDERCIKNSAIDRSAVLYPMFNSFYFHLILTNYCAFVSSPFRWTVLHCVSKLLIRCDQIQLFLKDLGYKFSCKNSLNIL